MAENFAHLDCDSFLLSAVGADMFGAVVLSETKKCGVHTEFVEVVGDKQTACYIMISDERGIPQYAVFDGGALDQISPAYIQKNSELLTSSDLLVTHTMVSVECLETLADIAFENAIPLYVNLSSAEMALRIEAIYDRRPIVAANQVEAESLIGHEIASPEAAMDGAQYLITRGASEVIITLGVGEAGLLRWLKCMSCQRFARASH